MKLIETKITRSNLPLIKENVKQAKTYVQKNQISEEDLEFLIKIDPSNTRKYVGWMAKMLIKDNPDREDLRNKIEEYHVFLEKGKAKTKDINQFKTYQDFVKEIDYLNQSGEGISVKDLESDYETILDNQDVLIMVPHTHEASRKLGLSHFAFRKCKDGSKDSAWCTTYKAPDHFNSYYYSNNVTFYYIKVKSKEKIKQLKEAFPEDWENFIVTALAVLEDGQIDGYDGLDNQISADNIKKFTEIIGIS